MPKAKENRLIDNTAERVLMVHALFQRYHCAAF